MKQITGFMSEISDEFKTVVVEAIHSVCTKFPRKHQILMTFLANMLREEVSSFVLISQFFAKNLAMCSSPFC